MTIAPFTSHRMQHNYLTPHHWLRPFRRRSANRMHFRRAHCLCSRVFRFKNGRLGARRARFQGARCVRVYLHVLSAHSARDAFLRIRTISFRLFRTVRKSFEFICI